MVGNGKVFGRGWESCATVGVKRNKMSLPVREKMNMGENKGAEFRQNKTGARQYTRVVLSIFVEIHSTHPISAYIFLLSPTLGFPPRFIDALFGVTGISGFHL